jgi:hypothetical protein
VPRTALFAVVELALPATIAGALTGLAIGATILATRRIRPPARSTREGHQDVAFPIVNARYPMPGV